MPGPSWAGPSWNDDHLNAIGTPTEVEASGDGTLIAIFKRIRTLLASVPVTGAGTLTVASGQVSGLGNNTLITPTSGKALRVSYASYNPTLALEAAFRFGAAGSLWLRNNLVANSVVSKDFGDLRWIQGAVDEVLILNLSAALATNWNVFYVEV